LTFAAQQRVEELFGDGPERTKSGGTRVRENQVKTVLSTAEYGEKTIKIFQ